MNLALLTKMKNSLVTLPELPVDPAHGRVAVGVPAGEAWRALVVGVAVPVARHAAGAAHAAEVVVPEAVAGGV